MGRCKSPIYFNNDNVEDQVVDFFLTESELIYPAKSYFVAIVYAKCLEKYFGGSFFEYLNDPELLPDDTYLRYILKISLPMII